MKTITCLLSLVLTASVFGADSSKILLRGTTAIAEEWKVTGAARAIVGDINVSADTIVYDRQKNLLRCEGDVVIRVLDHVMTSKDCVLQLSAGEKKVFIMSEGKISIGPGSVSFSEPAVPVTRIEGRNDRVKLHFEYSMRPDAAPASTAAPESARGR
jgi:lipopolysaccharide assembly outer membrane protein LptD (OstA)